MKQHRYCQSRREMITQIITAAGRPLTLYEIDAAMSVSFEGESNATTRARTSAALAQMQNAGLIVRTGPPRQGQYQLTRFLQLPKPGPVWRPLKVRQPYRREQWVAPGIRVSPAATVAIAVGPSARAEEAA